MKDKNIQLFLLPFAGGNSTSFKSLQEELDEVVESIPIEYSGRGSRAAEGYITEYKSFLDDIMVQITSKRNKELPYALFGYSMGASFAYEIVSQKLLDSDPEHIFYGARACIASQSLPKMSEEDFFEYSKTLGGYPEAVKSSRLLRLLMHPLKDDYGVAKQFMFEQGILPDCNATVFYCEEDTPYESVEGWKMITKGSTTFYEFGSNHFFIKDHYVEIADIINQTLAERKYS